ncbi:DUF4145 domain-containing protein [Variovorax humicola]|uniref:DUF4145 domain-containing protein n=1 Tax=Variovorax humicola TaxID=1769758 RepID=A0ABU8VUU0_9BURK
MATMASSSNFAFLSEHSQLLAELGASAERLFPFEPASCVVKLRLLAEAITQDIAARIGVTLSQPTQAELLRAVDMRLGMDAQVRQLFHLLRRTGNLAAHEVEHRIGFREGLDAIKVAREISVWFHRSFGKNPDFKAGPFVMPDDPSRRLSELQQQIQHLDAQLQDAQTVQAAQARAAELLEEHAAHERAMAQRAHEEKRHLSAACRRGQPRVVQLQAEFDAQLEKDRVRAGEESVSKFANRAAEAAKKVQIDEATTRQIIDLQLMEAGWEADTIQLTYSRGVQPERGKNKAIAEWPIKGRQAADYVLFAGLTPVAAVEANVRTSMSPGKFHRRNAMHVGSCKEQITSPLGGLQVERTLGRTAKVATSSCPSSIPAMVTRRSSNWPNSAVRGTEMFGNHRIHQDRFRDFIRRMGSSTSLPEVGRQRSSG